MNTVPTLTPVLLGATLLLGVTVSPPAVLAGTASSVSLDRAEVVAAEPIYRTVSYSEPVEQCALVEEPVYPEPRYRSRYRSYTGPILGAVIGGAIGNAVGHSKTNKKVGTAVGAVLGGTIGRDIQRRAEQQRVDTYGYSTHQVRYEQRKVCETVYQTREALELDGYDVTYRYAGQTHTARMDHDPGRYLEVRVRVTPV
jgi:uncharacterized protein YcfJ